ncbi:hypothetical protein [Methanobacterium alcaliphilum]|uniref:hypothetical protein n=1 Tax=Methanobacterium alcaliphilum TaxID=392018 RepID=UPI00200A31F9|nr:hypothetical protein [Methanobacterium alcaliphilum]MCK9150473.1 hypothetical protein [Methanobacterium alcaliphilum]
MRFHPSVSIFLGIICCFTLYLIAVLGFSANAWVGGTFTVPHNPSWFGTFLLILSFILSGVIATFFAKENKIKYGIFEGLCLILIFSIWSVCIWSLQHNVINFSNTIFSNVMLFLLVCVGSMFGMMADNEYNGFSPLLAVIAGSVIGYSSIVLLVLLTGYSPDPASYSVGMMSFIVGGLSSAIGGFVTTFFAKEKKIKYGIYTGILIIIIGLVQLLINMTTIYIHIYAFLGYVLSAAIGGYIAIMAAKHLKITPNQKFS